MDIALDEVLYFDGISSASTGAAADADSTPTFAVYEEATDTDIGIGGNMTKRTSLTGNYRGTFTLSAANGFEVGKWYVVIGSATIGGIATKGILKHFRVVAAEIVAGYPQSDAAKVGGQIASAAGTVTFPGTVASTTNITAGTITTTTNLTNLPAAAATAAELAKVPKSDSNVTWNSTALASINAEADTALNDYDGPTNAELATALGTADDATLAQIALVKAKTDLIPASPAATGDIPSAATIVAAVFARTYHATKMAGYTHEEIVALMASVLLGKASGLPTAPVFRNVGDTADAVSATTDTDGNRTAVTLTPANVR